ncbi:hypothetical protein DTO021D3_7046 [Paecilomyces variotii]|nr:hypothetical protein DTO032I3_3888 [Paecilomyces variotii]KAJ9276141.1 hypothetical protein DTO021D3_7046 [Paecilomyces variotii]KAJ9340210.1 hypothetical protein DTO027B6_7281 [Paecilomyces variotii]KAJ9377531.1 hypothetical protein DTO032I4_8070 [Paecilomyces variotii]KAJ9405713.1 hypothetical protein DTO045G8_6546 [Paecilomyces variotii]
MAAPGGNKHAFSSRVSFGRLCLLGLILFTLLILCSQQVPAEISSKYVIRPREDSKSPRADPDIVGYVVAAARGLSDISKEVSERFDLPTVRSASIHLDRVLAEATKSQRKNTKRGFLGDLFGGGSDSSSNNDDFLSGLKDILSGGQSTSNSSGSGILDDLLQKGVGSLFSGFTGGLDNIAVSLGVGLGAGTAQGLNLSTQNQISTLASSAAVMNGAKPTGLNQLTTKFGSGLTAAIVPLAIKALPLNGQTDFGQVAFTLAQGIGNGTSSGLRLTNSTFSPQKGSDLSTLAGNLGLGLSEPIAGSVNISKILSSLMPSNQQSLGQAAFSLAQGIGNGTSSGLKLSNASFAPANGSDLSSLAGNVGLGLSEPIARNVNISQLLGSVMPSNQQNLGLAAFALAQGIGNGTSSGLRLSNTSFQPLNNSDLTALAGNLGLGISEPIARNVNLSSLFNSAVSTSNLNIGQAVFSLAQGIGNGTSSGLGLSKKHFSPSTSSDLASLAGNVGLGISEPIVGSVNLSKVLNSAISTDGQQSLLAQLPGVLGGAGKGLGEGAAQGLGISKSSPANTLSARSNGRVDIPGFAELFTRSLSSSFLGSANLSTITAGAGNIRESLVSQLPGVASALGTGLGQGSAQGLGLVKASAQIAARDSSSINVPLVVQDFAQSLSSSFLSTANLSDITSQIGGQNPLGNFSIDQILQPAALGLGSGLGKGAAIGLGLKKAENTTDATDSSASGLDVEAIMSDFAQGLSQSFLANGTLNNLMSQSGNLLGNSTINLGKVGEGLARGLVGGAADAIDSAGGLQNIIDGNGVVNVIPNSSFGQSAISFNDSVGGAAAGFGRGLGGEGVALLVSLLHNGTAGLTQAATVQRRDNSPFLRLTGPTTPSPIGHPDLTSTVHAKRAQTGGIFSTINVTLIDSLLQKSSDALTCEGIGGLFGVLSGLMASKTLPQSISSTDDLNSSALGLPTTPVTIQNSGNEFNIDLQKITLSVNGLSVVKFAVLTALHVLFVISAYFFILPSILSLHLIERIAQLSAKPLRTNKSKRWSKYLEYFIYLPLSISGTILGIIGMGSSRHLRTAHGIIGLITLILTILSFAFSHAITMIFENNNKAKAKSTTISAVMTYTLLGISLLAMISGFSDLRSFSFCILQNIPLPILVGIGVGIVGGVNAFGTLLGVKCWLERRVTQQGKEKGGDDSERDRRKMVAISRPMPMPMGVSVMEEVRVGKSRFSDG